MIPDPTQVSSGSRPNSEIGSKFKKLKWVSVSPKPRFLPSSSSGYGFVKIRIKGLAGPGFRCRGQRIKTVKNSFLNGWSGPVLVWWCGRFGVGGGSCAVVGLFSGRFWPVLGPLPGTAVFN